MENAMEAKLSDFKVGDVVINLTSIRATVESICPERGLLLRELRTSKNGRRCGTKWYADPAKCRKEVPPPPIVFGPPAPRATRYPELGYAQHDAGLWRAIDMKTLEPVGPQYKTKAELMGDLDRYAQDFGCLAFEPEIKVQA
jgi:hypothetical protein